VNRKSKIKLILVTTTLGLSTLFLHFTGYLEILIQLFTSPDYLEQTIEPYESYGVFILLGLQILQIVFAPIPGQAIGVTYGVMYGVYWGTFFGMIGTTIGTIIPILISKRYGKPIVKSMIGEQKFEKYEELTKSTDVYPFVILIILPVIPDDAIAYLAGLSSISTRRLIIWLAVARFPGMLALTWFGEGLATANYFLMLVLTVLITIVSMWVVWKRKWILEKLSEN